MRWVVLALVPFVVAACSKTEAKKDVLPPASGSALPPPAVPKLSGAGENDAGKDEDVDGHRGTGTLHPKESAELGPKQSGVISAISVEEGDKVKKGQLLFRLESRQAQLAVEQAKAAQASAEVAERTAQIEYDRTKKLFDRGAVSEAAHEQAQARLDAAKAAVEQAKTAVSLARKSAADTAVRSPIAGVVTAKLKNVGETATMMPPTIVLVVQDTSKLELRARLPERVLADLSPGEPISVRIPALGKALSVPIERINPAVDPRTRTIEVVAMIDNADGKLRSGMLAEVSFDGAKADAAP